MKQDLTLSVRSCTHPAAGFAELVLERPDGQALPAMVPGQFVEVLVPRAPHTMLRRPISVNFVSADNRQLTLLVRVAGEGTEVLASMTAGQQLKVLLPLGRGFTVDPAKRVLLVGGGVGVAPLLYMSEQLQKAGGHAHVLLGARTEEMLLQRDRFEQYATVHLATDDGSCGHHGVVTTHPAMLEGDYDLICCCGPEPMMKAVARVARERGIDCEVSLENLMACGLGACLCCVQKTTSGHRCVCTEGPVFNTAELEW